MRSREDIVLGGLEFGGGAAMVEWEVKGISQL